MFFPSKKIEKLLENFSKDQKLSKFEVIDESFLDEIFKQNLQENTFQKRHSSNNKEIFFENRMLYVLKEEK